MDAATVANLTGLVIVAVTGAFMLGFWLAAQIASGIVDGKRGQ